MSSKHISCMCHWSHTRSKNITKCCFVHDIRQYSTKGSLDTGMYEYINTVIGNEYQSSYIINFLLFFVLCFCFFDLCLLVFSFCLSFAWTISVYEGESHWLWTHPEVLWQSTWCWIAQITWWSHRSSATTNDICTNRHTGWLSRTTSIHTERSTSWSMQSCGWTWTNARCLHMTFIF